MDIPNNFMQTSIKKLDIGDRITMKITGALVDLPVEDNPEMYSVHNVCKGNTKVLCVEVLRATHEMLISALLFYLKLKEDLESMGFECNPHDACLGNRMVDRKATHCTLPCG